MDNRGRLGCSRPLYELYFQRIKIPYLLRSKTKSLQNEGLLHFSLEISELDMVGFS
jgi:hypothetical protein